MRFPGVGTDAGTQYGVTPGLYILIKGRGKSVALDLPPRTRAYPTGSAYTPSKGKGLYQPTHSGHQAAFWKESCLDRHGRSRLGEDLGACEFRHFQSNVRVGNARFRGLHIFGLNPRVGYGIFKAGRA